MNPPLTVLMSFPRPRRESNPYNTLLMDSLAARPDVEVLTFTWRRALTGRYDLFHAHWPEILVSGRTPLRTLVRQALFVALLLRLRLLRRPIVRTLHNIELPRGLSRRQVALLRWAERWTTLWILINEDTEAPAGRPTAVALHGHYRDWYGRYPAAPRVPGRVAFFGRIRRYKNAVGLVRAFRHLSDPDASLVVGGLPSSDELTAELRDAAGGDARIEFRFAFIDEPALVELVTAAQLVVLPYPEMHNSGSAFAALSLGRPVLLPDNAVNRHLADEVGDAFVHLYDGELTAAHISETLSAVATLPADAAPNLSRREWPLIAEQHEAAYREALTLAHAPRGGRQS